MRIPALLLTLGLVATTLVVPAPASADHCLLGQDAILKLIGQCRNRPPTASDPQGPTRVALRQSAVYCATYTDPDGDSGSMSFFFTNFGGRRDYAGVASGDQRCPSWSWDQDGEYCVAVSAQDQFGARDDDNGCLWVIAGNPYG